jgi:hypothetical protein
MLALKDSDIWLAVSYGLGFVLVLLLFVVLMSADCMAGRHKCLWQEMLCLWLCDRWLHHSKLGPEFDDDPRRWRMPTEALTTAGAQHDVN